MHHATPDIPSAWTGSSPLMDLDDPMLRLRVLALTQLQPTARRQAMALHAFVKGMPLHRAMKSRLRRASEVLRAGSGDAADKATLLVAMLRIAGLPARMRFLSLRSPILRGLGIALLQPARPLVEVWLDRRWVRTDCYIFDAHYMAAARQRLKHECAEYGWGIHVQAAPVWDGQADAFLSARPPDRDPMVAQDLGCHHDPGGFLAAQARSGSRRWRARLLQWNLMTPRLQGRLQAVRDGRGLPPPQACPP